MISEAPFSFKSLCSDIMWKLSFGIIGHCFSKIWGVDQGLEWQQSSDGGKVTGYKMCLSLLPPGGQETELGSSLQCPQHKMWLNAQTCKTHWLKMSTSHKSQLIKPPQWNGRLPSSSFLSLLPFSELSIRDHLCCLWSACVPARSSVPVMYLLGTAFAEST